MASETVVGLHAVRRLLSDEAGRVKRVMVSSKRDDDRIREIVALAKKAGLSVEHIDAKKLDQRTGGANHQGVLAEVRAAKPLSDNDLHELIERLEEPAFLLVLDGVQDPHNLGACLRTADAAGVHAVIAPRDRSCGLNQTALKVAAGASVPFVQVVNLARALAWLKERNVWLYGASDEATQSVYDADLTGPLALVLGGEGAGLRRLTREACDHAVSLPMAGRVESLNVSVAAGICLYEAVRQRHAQG